MLRMLCYKVWISKIWKGTSSRILLATYGKPPERLGHLKKDACLKKVEICMVESFDNLALDFIRHTLERCVILSSVWCAEPPKSIAAGREIPNGESFGIAR